MTITVTGDNLYDLRSKIGARERPTPIKIRWRDANGRLNNSLDVHETGCVVDARNVFGEEVERSFKTAGQAIRYVASLIRRHEAYAKQSKRQFVKEQRAKAAK